jgi:hypothetical protein
MRLSSVLFQLLIFALALAVSACFNARELAAPQVSVTEIEPSGRAAKGPDCSITVLKVEPSERFEKVAIVEGWGTEEQRDELLAALKQRACETGADALLLITDRSQQTTKLVYDPANAESGEAGNGTAEESQAQGILQKKHIAKVGEAGHSGYYIDSYAIIRDTNR